MAFANRSKVKKCKNLDIRIEVKKNEFMVEIYSKGLSRAIDKVLLMQFS